METTITTAQQTIATERRVMMVSVLESSSETSEENIGKGYVPRKKPPLGTGNPATAGATPGTGFKIPIVRGIPDSLSCIPESKNPGFWIPLRFLKFSL